MTGGTRRNGPFPGAGTEGALGRWVTSRRGSGSGRDAAGKQPGIGRNELEGPRQRQRSRHPSRKRGEQNGGPEVPRCSRHDGGRIHTAARGAAPGKSGRLSLRSGVRKRLAAALGSRPHPMSLSVPHRNPHTQRHDGVWVKAAARLSRPGPRPGPGHLSGLRVLRGRNTQSGSVGRHMGPVGEQP